MGNKKNSARKMFLFTPSYLFFWINLILFRKQDKWFSISTKCILI